MFLGAFGTDLGVFGTSFVYAFRERENLLDLFEEVSGDRLMYAYFRPGGVAWDVPGYLRDPMGPLAIRWSYLPKIAPWLMRFIAASKPERVEEISIALRSLMTRALVAHKSLAKEAGEPEILRETGWLAVFETDNKFQSYQWDLELQKRRGVPFQILPSEEIRQFEPSLQPIIRHAVYYPENAYAADNYRLVKLLAADFVRRGGAILQEKVTGFEMGHLGDIEKMVTWLNAFVRTSV